MQFHLGIYAVIEQEERLLLVKKSRGPYRGMWDLPGGRPTHGESILQTLLREVSEETGIQLIAATPLLNQVFVVKYHDGNKNISLHHTCLIYQATQFDASQFQKAIHEEDVAGSAWIKKSELTHLPLSRAVGSLYLEK